MRRKSSKNNKQKVGSLTKKHSAKSISYDSSRSNKKSNKSGKAKIGSQMRSRPKNRKMDKKLLINASEDKRFWVFLGPVVKNLAELKDALVIMSDEQFSHHVNEYKNDFAQWIEDVLGDQECAADLRKKQDKKGVLQAVVRHLRKYSY